jgi:hypothetical protein
MRISRNPTYVVLAVLLAVLLAGWAAPAKALVLDWDGVAWTPGSLSHSYDVSGDGLTDVTLTIASQQNNIWTTDPTTGTQTPAINQTLTGGLSPVQNSLMLAANLKTQSDVTVQLNFTGGQYGAGNVSFSIFDIDVTTNSDIISNIYGVALDGSLVAATITGIGSTVTLSGTGLNQVLTGNGSAANNSSNGNVTISFGSTIITDVFFMFSNTSGAPRYQDIGIGDINFTPVPEINPAISAVASCLGALGLTAVMQRRSRRRQAPR